MWMRLLFLTTPPAGAHVHYCVALYHQLANGDVIYVQLSLN